MEELNVLKIGEKVPDFEPDVYFPDKKTCWTDIR